MRYKPSYYNIRVAHGEWMLLYNGVSSGLIRLPLPVAEQLASFLGPERPRTAGTGYDRWETDLFDPDELPEAVQPVFDQLLQGNYFVEADVNELEKLEERYRFHRENSPFHVTITTTMDCNLGCYYCYEDKTKQYLTKKGCDIILEWIREQAIEKNHERLYIDWYGGEPMLNREAIEYFSEEALALCEELGMTYSASMISNGTRWPDDPAEFVKKIHLKHVQFSLDGPEQEHNKRRRYLDEAENPDGSFGTILDTIDSLLGSTKIYVRVNVDPWVGREALSLIDVFKERGWLEPGLEFYPMLAAIGPLTENCGFLEQTPEVTRFQANFDELFHEFQSMVGQHMGSDALRHTQYYPQAVTINCAAVSDNAVIFGPEGRLYKCCLEVGDTQRSHGAIDLGGTCSSPIKGEAPKNSLPVVNEKALSGPAHATDRWDKYDPFSHEKCSQCQYLPVCMGGCPKSQIENHEYYLKMQSQYWEESIDDVIREYYDAEFGAPAETAV